MCEDVIRTGVQMGYVGGGAESSCWEAIAPYQRPTLLPCTSTQSICSGKCCTWGKLCSVIWDPGSPYSISIPLPGGDLQLLPKIFRIGLLLATFSERDYITILLFLSLPPPSLHPLLVASVAMCQMPPPSCGGEEKSQVLYLHNCLHTSSPCPFQIQGDGG